MVFCHTVHVTRYLCIPACLPGLLVTVELYFFTRAHGATCDNTMGHLSKLCANGAGRTSFPITMYIKAYKCELFTTLEKKKLILKKTEWGWKLLTGLRHMMVLVRRLFFRYDPKRCGRPTLYGTVSEKAERTYGLICYGSGKDMRTWNNFQTPLEHVIFTSKSEIIQISLSHSPPSGDVQVIF